MPDDVAEEKSRALEALGAKVEKVRPSSIVDKKQFVVRLPTKRPVFQPNQPLSYLFGVRSFLYSQNVAKQRALDFGSTELTNQVEGVSVSTTAAKDEVDHASRRNRRFSSSAVENKPRGFFADQFEVRGLVERLWSDFSSSSRPNHLSLASP